MLGFVARLLGGAVSPIVDQASAFGASLLRKLALFLVAAVCLVVVVGALTVAFDLWITSLAGAIVGALAVAGLYLAVAIVCVVLALRGGRKAKPDERARASEGGAAHNDGPGIGESVDQFTAPVLAMLQSLGLRREQLAVMAGAGLAKQLKPLPLVGLAIVGGFLVGRMWRGWDALLSGGLLDALLATIVPGRRDDEGDDGRDLDERDLDERELDERERDGRERGERTDGRRDGAPNTAVGP